MGKPCAEDVFIDSATNGRFRGKIRARELTNGHELSIFRDIDTQGVRHGVRLAPAARVFAPFATRVDQEATTSGSVAPDSTV